MESDNADVFCYKRVNRSHMMARCYAKVEACGKGTNNKLLTQRLVRRTSIKGARILYPPSMGRKCSSATGAGYPTDANSKSTPTFEVITQMGMIIPEQSNEWILTHAFLQSSSARLWPGADALRNFGSITKLCKYYGFKKSPTSY